MSELSKEEIKSLYNHKELPKVSNHFAHAFRCFAKLFAIAVFCIGAVLLAFFVFPFIRLFSKRKGEDFGIDARAYVSKTFRRFLGFLQLIHTSKLLVEDKEAFHNIKGKVLIANHPSLLDFVYLMSLLPNSTCIVRGNLIKTPLGGVIRQAYITNTTDFDDVLVECKKLLNKGCNVIIFPEGTRSPRHGQNNYKKGAARIALYSGSDVQPFFIGGSDKYGLGKHDPIWSFNPVEKYTYDIKILPVISVSEFAGESEPIAAKHLTKRMEEVIRSAGDEYSKSPITKTLNNYEKSNIFSVLVCYKYR